MNAFILVELQRSQPEALNGDPVNILRDLPKGTGLVLRFPSRERDQMTKTRRAFTKAAAKLREQNANRGLLMTSAREEADVISLYAWFTGDDSQGRTKNTPQIQPRGSTETITSTIQEAPPSHDNTGISSTPSDNSAVPQERSLTLAAAELGVSEKTVRRAIKSGRLPARLIPGPHGPEYRVDITQLIQPSSRNQDPKQGEPKPNRRSAEGKSQTKESEALTLLSQRINALEGKINQILGN